MDTSAFIAQFESATAELGLARETMLAQLREFSSEAASLDLPPGTLDDAGTRIDDEFASVESTQRAALENARTQIEQTHQQLDTTLTELLAAAPALATEQAERAATHSSAIAEEQSSFEEAVRGFADSQRGYEQDIASAHAEQLDAHSTFEQGLQAARARIDSELAPQLGEGIDVYADSVSGELSSALESAFERGAGTTREAFGNAASALSQGFESAFGDLDRGAREIGDHVGESLRDSLDEGARQLVEGATRRLAEEVVEGVVTSQAGVAVTTALGPYLPALIAVRRATDVIKHGLELLKKVTTLGLG